MKLDKKYRYQLGYSKTHYDATHNMKIRSQKANKIISILKDYCRKKLKLLTILDIGCSSGIMPYFLSKESRNTVGIDLDSSAINYARKRWKSKNLKFYVKDGINTKFHNDTFDIVVANHVYEHVPDAGRLIEEVKRILKPNGICYFAASNRITFMETHYNLPFLSLLPKPLAHLYLRLFRREKFYYENLMTYWSLKKLVSSFKRIDYTMKIVSNPIKYNATDMVKPNSLKQKIYMFVIKYFPWLSKTFVWILQD